MNVSKMDHAMLSFGLMGGLLVPRPAPRRRGLFAWLSGRPVKPAGPSD